MIARRVTVIIGLLANPMSQRVDTKSSLLKEKDAQNTTVYKPTPPVIPSHTSHKHGKSQAHYKNNRDVVPVLPHHHRILIQIRDICPADAFGVLFYNHPAKVRIEETFADGIGISICVCVAVVSTVAARPPTNRALYSAAAKSRKPNAKGKGGRIGTMSPETMIS